MKLKQILIGCAAMALFTCIGFFSAMYGATVSESTGQLNILYFVGKILLWPWLLSDEIRTAIFPEHKGYSFLSIGISQFVGYSLLFYVLAKMYERLKR